MFDGPALIFVLFVVGFLLLAAEVFVPGLIVGTLGFLCLVASVALVFYHYGALAGSIAGLVVGTLSIGGIIVWLNVFQKTFIGRRIILSRRQNSSPPTNEGLVGEEGVTVTALRPSGPPALRANALMSRQLGNFWRRGQRSQLWRQTVSAWRCDEKTSWSPPRRPFSLLA